MVNEETCKICLERIPYCTLAGFMISGLGILLLFTFKNDLVELSTVITKKFYLKSDPCSINNGDKFITYLFLAFICLSALVIVMGFVTNGDLRARFFRAPAARFFGIIICFLLLVLTLVLICWWIHRAEFYSQYAYFVKATEIECLMVPIRGSRTCVNQDVGNFMMNSETILQYDICYEFRSMMCTDFIKRFENKLPKIYAAFCVIILGQVIYCMCLAANCIKIRCQAKFQELEDLRSLELEMST